MHQPFCCQFMSNFLGSLVLLSLSDGSHVQGTLASIDTAAGQLELYRASHSARSEVILPYLQVKRADVRELKLLAQANASTLAPSGPPAPPKSASFADPAILSVGRPSPSPASSLAQQNPVASTSTSKGILQVPGHVRAASVPRRKKKKAGVLLQPRGSEADESATPAYEDSHDESTGFDSEDGEQNGVGSKDDDRPARVTKHIKGRKEGQRAATASHTHTNGLNDEFDFAGGLARFDKKQIFAEISALDKSDPSLLLVSHNRRNKVDARYTTKLLPTENVLDDTPTAADLESTDTEQVKDGLRGSARPPVITPRATRRASSKTFFPPAIHGPRGKAMLVTTKQIREVEVSANVETGPNQLQRIENGGRSIAQLILDHNAGLLAEENAAPKVVILTGANAFNGPCAVRAGAHLLNHGAVVWVYLNSATTISAKFELHLRLLSSAGGILARSPAELPHCPDIIIDAIVDADHNEALSQSIDSEAIDYANAQTAPTLSINWPSGSDPDTGEVRAEAVVPAATICLGAVRKGALAGPNVTGALWLADLGLPPAAFERVAGLEDWTSPFDRRFAVQMRFE